MVDLLWMEYVHIYEKKGKEISCQMLWWVTLLKNQFFIGNSDCDRPRGFMCEAYHRIWHLIQHVWFMSNYEPM